MDDEVKRKHYELAEKLISEQNFAAAVIVGAVATVLAAAAYGIIVYLSRFSYGFATVGIGIFVGLSVGFLGRGISSKFAVLATFYTTVGCMLGNMFRVIVIMLAGGQISPIEALQNISLQEVVERSSSYYSLVDFVYWFVAVFAAVFLAKRSLSRSESLAVGLYNMKR